MQSPYIWVPKFKLAEAMVCPPPGRIAGIVGLRGSLPDGRSRVIMPERPNLILDAGLDRWGVGTPIIYAAVGSSNQTPLVTDTAIVSFVAQHDSVRSNTEGVQPTPPYYGWQRWVFRFNPPGADRTLREVTTGWGTAGESAWARSLIKDENGDPIDVTWLSNETLDFTYEARFYPFGVTYDGEGGVVLNDTLFSLVCNGITHTGKIRPAGLNNADGGWAFSNATKMIDKARPGTQSMSPTVYNGSIGLITGTPTGDNHAVYNQGWTENPYVPGSHKRTGSHTFGPEQANLPNGISAVHHATNGGSYQFDLSPAILKIEDWSLTMNLETPTWQRYLP